MAISLELENDELAVLFFNLQLNEKYCEDPIIEKLLFKMESIIYSRFSIDEIETYKKSVMNRIALGES
ncbi:MAG: hypothetical protein PF518_14005 [Spirochaetaceae bacterium]|nr:hypothetical protein [Spirochaetaceae bacterium]